MSARERHELREEVDRLRQTLRGRRLAAFLFGFIACELLFLAAAIAASWLL